MTGVEICLQYKKGNEMNGLLLLLIGILAMAVKFAVESLIVSLVLAIYVSLATKIVAGFMPKYLQVLKYSFIACIVLFVMMTIIMVGQMWSKYDYTNGIIVYSNNGFLIAITFILWLLSNGSIYGQLANSEGKKIGLFKGFVVNLVTMFAISFTLFSLWCLTDFPVTTFLPIVLMYL